jgi:hypothetical protein
MFYKTHDKDIEEAIYVCRYQESAINLIQDALVHAVTMLQFNNKIGIGDNSNNESMNSQTSWVLLNLLRDIRMAKSAEFKFIKNDQGDEV